MKVILTLGLFLATLGCAASAEPVTVHHTRGAMRGFLTIRTQSGTLLGHAEYIEFVVGDRVTERLTMNFRDGSLDDETAVFTQKNVFQFVSDHHVQRGPFFKNSIDMTIEANGHVTIQTTGRDGKVKNETSHFDLPPDLSNGFVGTLLLNVPHNGPGLSLGMLLPTEKGRLARLDITPAGTMPVSVSPGDRRTASLFRIKVNLGGVAGVIAPMVGKQPADAMLWIVEGEVPGFVREVAQLSEGGPIISLELAGTSFSHTAAK